MEYRKTISALAMIGISAFLVACDSGHEGRNASGGDTLAMSYAHNLVMVEYDNHTDVTMIDPWDTTRVLARYTLTSDTTQHGAGVIHVPLRNAAVFTSVHCSLFDELGVADCIGGVCDLQYMPLAVMHDRVSQGLVADLGNSMEPNMERLIDLMPDAILRSPYEQSGGYGKIGRLDIPVVECADYMEVSPLARAEWIRFYGRLTGLAERADSIFRQVERNYKAAKATASKARHRPKLLCEAPYNGQWYMPAGGSTMGQMYADAGADYLFADIPGTGSSPMSIEHVLERALDADVWLVKTYGLSSRAQLIHDTPLLKGITASLWVCDPSQTGFYEQTPFHPDLLLQNLTALLHPELHVKPSKEYFHPLP